MNIPKIQQDTHLPWFPTLPPLCQLVSPVYFESTHPTTTQSTPLSAVHMATAAINVSLEKLGPKHLLYNHSVPLSAHQLSCLGGGCLVETSAYAKDFLKQLYVTSSSITLLSKSKPKDFLGSFITICVLRWGNAHFHASSQGHSVPIFSMGILGGNLLRRRGLIWSHIHQVFGKLII